MSLLRRFCRRGGVPPEVVHLREGRPRLLMITGERRNQNYYRDRELAGRFSTLWLSEAFPLAAYGYDLQKIWAGVMPGAPPDWVWVNYQRQFTPQLKGWEALRAPVVAFVGDPQDFVLDTPVHQEKVAFFRRLQAQILVTPYPRAEAMVRGGLGDTVTPLIPCYWAIDPDIFRPLGQPRVFDIACYGSHTPTTYPFRNQVRQFLESQKRLRFDLRLRVSKGHDGPAFAQALNRCRAAFTCASRYGYPLGKYFEIPACGTLLLAEAVPDLELLGFRPGEHYVAVTPDDFAPVMEHYLLGDPGEAERIAAAGAAWVRARHSWAPRVSELLAALAPVGGGAGNA